MAVLDPFSVFIDNVKDIQSESEKQKNCFTTSIEQHIFIEKVDAEALS